MLVGDTPDATDALVHEGVLVAGENRLRFFHQEFFDYVFAVQHVRNGQTAVDILRDDLQDLIRRGQVSAVQCSL